MNRPRTAPRDYLLDFACDMELELRRNDHKGGWDCMTPAQLIHRARQELREVEKAVESNGDVVSECADVANFMAFLATNWKEREDQPKRGWADCRPDDRDTGERTEFCG